MENNQIDKSNFAVKRNEIEKTKILKWCSSWGILVLAILFTGTTIFSVIDIIQIIKSGIVSILIASIPLLLNILCSVGVWQIYIYSLKKQVNPSGAKLIRGVWQFYKSIVCIILILLDIVLILIVSIGADFISKIGNSAGNVAGIVSGDLQDSIGTLTTSGIGILIAILFVFILVTVLFIVFMSKVTKFANNVYDTLLYSRLNKVSTLGAAVFLFLMGGGIILLTFKSPYNVVGILRSLLLSGSFIALGILALQYGGLYNKVEYEYRVLNNDNSN